MSLQVERERNKGLKVSDHLIIDKRTMWFSVCVCVCVCVCVLYRSHLKDGEYIFFFNELCVIYTISWSGA
jgi:hypothetical protein